MSHEDLEDSGTPPFLLRPALYAWLPKTTSGPYDPVDEAKRRLAAVELLETTVAGLRRNPVEAAWIERMVELLLETPPAGLQRNPVEAPQVERMAYGLSIMRATMERALEVAELAVIHLGQAGLRLDPDALGGGTWNRGTRGPAPSVLFVYVRNLLLERCPEWAEVVYQWRPGDGPRPPFPEPNNQELREWLSAELAKASRVVPWGEEEIDPRSRGPLWNIVSNLQRRQ